MRACDLLCSKVQLPCCVNSLQSAWFVIILIFSAMQANKIPFCRQSATSVFRNWWFLSGKSQSFSKGFFVRAVAAFCHCWFKSSFHWLTRSNVMLCNQCKIILFRGFDKTSLLFLFLCSNRHDPVHYHSGILVWFWLGLQHALQHLINLPGAFHSLPSCSTWTLSLILKVFIIYVHIHRNLVASHCVTEKCGAEGLARINI